MTKREKPPTFMGSTIIIEDGIPLGCECLFHLSLWLRPPSCAVQDAGDFNNAFTDALNGKEG